MDMSEVCLRTKAITSLDTSSTLPSVMSACIYAFPGVVHYTLGTDAILGRA